MAKPLAVSFNFAALCWLIALFSISMLQSIKSQDHNDLFYQLNDAKLEIEEIDNLLDAVEDNNNVKLGRKTVSELLRLRDTSNVDCSFDRLLADKYYFGKDYLHGYYQNKGLDKFCNYYFYKRCISCIDKVVENIDTEVAHSMDADAIEVLNKFWLEVHPEKGEMILGIKRRARELINAYLLYWARTWKEKSDESAKRKLESSCNDLSLILDRAFPDSFWRSYDELLDGHKVSLGWLNIGYVCSVYKATLQKGDGQLISCEEAFFVSYSSSKPLGNGLCWIVPN